MEEWLMEKSKDEHEKNNKEEIGEKRFLPQLVHMLKD